MNGGKDVKIGHDKRPVSVIPSDEQLLYNIANGEILTDEFGNPLVTKVDQFFLADASKDRSTSVVFPENPKDIYPIKKVTQVGIVTATYGVDFDVDVRINNNQKITVLKRTGQTVPVGVSTVKERPIPPQTVAIGITFTDFNQCEIRTREPNVGSFNDKNNLYFSNPSDIANVDLRVPFNVSGHNIPAGSHVVKKDFDRIKISQPVTAGVTTDKVVITRTDSLFYEADNVLKVAEEFVETSEVSTTLLGVNRAETQLSLFSNVSSYGLNDDEWESFSYNTGVSKASWDTRPNKTYGNRYLARIEEETQESAIKLSGFPPSHSYPFGPEWEKIGLYDKTLFDQYINFIRLGNLAYDLFSIPALGYPASWISKFLNPADVDFNEDTGEIVYAKIPGRESDFSSAFQKIDEWTETWRAIGEGKSLLDPVTGNYLSFGSLKTLLANNDLTSIYDGSNTRPGYSTDYRRYSTIQSRRVFRYQPGRISGFTFGLRSSTEPVSGIALEWGIKNETDEYVFKIYAGQLSIVRRSTVPLERSVLIRNGLDPTENPTVQINGTSYNTVQPEIPSGDPFDVNDDQGPLDGGDEDRRARKFHTIEIPRDKFNGDPLNGNGPSGYTIRPEKVTMWKIEFGWYGAIGARFYAYIPTGNGDARWVVIHTLVIENSLTGPCLRDSYFRFKYSLDIFNTANLKTPQFLYKYGASYYIDGGDEGTSEIYSVSTGLTPKQISTANETSLFGVRPKDVITNSSGVNIANRKLILPTKFSMSTNTLTEVKVKTCRACAGFGQVFTPGVKTGDSGRSMTIKFEGTNLITAVGVGASFSDADIGAKLIAPSIFGAYIVEMDQETATTYTNGFKTYESAKIYGWGPGLDNYPNYNKLGGVSGRPIAGVDVKDYAQGGITTKIAIDTYPHAVRLSNYDVHFASDYEINGAEIDIQFMNPINKDQSSLGGSNTHFADFMIGVTDKRPSVNIGNPNLLDGWLIPWNDYTNLDSIDSTTVSGVTTSVLPEREILFGEHTHSFVNMDENQVEVAEAWSNGTFKCRMGQDVRIPTVTSTSGGACSIIKIRVSDPIDLATGVSQIYSTQTPDGQPTGDGFKYFLISENSFGGDITDWEGGQVVYRDDDGSVNQDSQAKYAQNQPVTYTSGGQTYQYIQISDSVKLSKAFDATDETKDGSDSNINLLGRPVQLRASRLGVISKNKLFKYDVYPLFLVGKLMDKAQINNISIKETTGIFQKTTAPVLSVTNGSNGTIDLANNNTFNDATPPTNFVSVDRLSSSSIDTQNEQVIRPSTTKDIFYVGENETKEVDMTKVFGVDRNVITPDNNNIEVTFITAKQLGTGGSKFVQGSLNYKEQ